MPGTGFKIPLVAAVTIALAVALYLWLGRSQPVEVVTAVVDHGTVQDTVSNTRAGTIKACRRAGISPSIGGQIINLPVKEGDTVETGQLLMELWNDDRTAQLELAQSESRAAAATARQTCIKAEVAAREAQRQQQLLQKKLTSEEAVDKADGEARAQQAACHAARAVEDVRQAQIHVAQAELDRTRLSAPFAGIVAEVNGEVGEFVTPSPVGIPTPPAVDLVDNSCLYVSAPIDEVDAPQIRVGMPARISLDAMGASTFPGRVRRIAPYVLEVEKQARTVDVEVDFQCTTDCADMLPGYSADIEVIVAEKGDALRIPTEAILEGNRVLVLTADGLLEERNITTGLGNWVWSEVRSGLEAGEEVVLSVERDGVEDGATAVRETPTDREE